MNSNQLPIEDMMQFHISETDWITSDLNNTELDKGSLSDADENQTFSLTGNTTEAVTQTDLNSSDALTETVEDDLSSAQIQGSNWNDLDGDGVRDAGEQGLANWSVYLDTNKNGQLDAGETSTTTDADGNYTFIGLTAGTYTVGEVQKAGWTQTFPGTAAQSTLIPIADRRDLIFDSQRDLLYITTSDGDVERYDINSKSLLTAIDAGNSLNGGDITADGSALYIAENQRGATQGFIRKVNLNDGIVTNIGFDFTSWDDTPSDVAIASNGKALIRKFGQWGNLLELDLSTDTISERTDKWTVYGGAQITRSADRSFFFVTQDGISSGPIFTYDALTNTFSEDKWTNSYLGGNLSAVNRNASIIALEWGTGISIMDRNLNSIENLSNVDGGLAFDPVKDVLYAANSTTDQIIAFDTNTWDELYRLNIGEDIGTEWYNPSNPFGDGMMTVSDDSQHLFMSTPSGVRMFDLSQEFGPAGTHTVNLSEGQIAENIDFGNQQTTPPPTLSINDLTVFEGNTSITNAVVTVSLDKVSSEIVTVNYTTADDTAIAGEDYLQTSGTLTFAAGETTQQIQVSVLGDTQQETTETFKINLTNPTNATIADAEAVGTIFNDDTLSGNAGHDLLVGTAGHDSLYGGMGMDTLDGLDGHDLLDGGSDHDLLDAGAGHDTLRGGTGHDTLNGGAGKDTLNGGAGDDWLNGGSGEDVLIGCDSLATSPGVGELDTLTGGSASDRFILGDAGQGAYYNDGNSSSSGSDDFALLRGFNLSEDFIQLAGSATDYILSSVGSGTNIYLDNDGTSGFSSKDELIAKVASVTDLNLTESYFLYS